MIQMDDEALSRVMEPNQKPSAIMQYFGYDHLPSKLQGVSRQFKTLAWWIEDNLPDGPEKSVTLRKLLEAKDAAVRSALDL